MPVQRGALIADGGNMTFALKDFGNGRPLKLSYQDLPRILQPITGDVNFVFKAYYTAHRDPVSVQRREPFYAALRDAGWIIYDTVSKECFDGQFRDKGVDLSIALDAYRLALKEQVQIVALLTHDEDFVALFKRLPREVKGYVIGFENQMASALKTVATPVYLESLAGALR
jgi:uncharacterized LabA/DUF88 family protein